MNDLISRREAIKAIESLPNCYNGFSDAYDKAYIIGTLEELPPAVKVVRCKDCRYWDKTKYSDYATMGECTIWHTARNRKEYCSEGRVKDGKDNG